MARSLDPNSAGCQFFICLASRPDLDHQYTTFGKLIKGDDVLGKIGDTPCKQDPRARPPPSVPLTRMGIVSVKIVPASSVK
jgi:peptidyl-prolyl cis-trans isomerase B (cyclophilin B)